MDSCFIDITVEFLAVAFHNILYYASVYHHNIFETKKKYSIVVHRSMHPEVNEYIDLCLKSIAACLKTGQLKRVEFAVTDTDYVPYLKFIFDFDKCDYFDDTADAYLVQAEQNLRAFCLHLAEVKHKFGQREDCSFSIYLHTDESTAVAMATDPDLEEFPMVEVEEKCGDSDRIIPMRRFSLRNYSIDTYIEMY